MTPPDVTPPALPGDGPRVLRCGRTAMACRFELYVAHEDEKYARQAAEAALAEVTRLECEFSRFRHDSDITRLNAAPPGTPVRIGADLLHCLAIAAEVQAATNGAFDVTFRTPAAVRTQLRDAGRPPLLVDATAFALGRAADGVLVDLGAIGKGYALDRMADVLATWRIPAALLHSGQSTVLALGPPPDEAPWDVQLRGPRVPGTPHVALRSVALSGSGQELHGAHIVDPRTDQPAESGHAAWALAPSAAAADAYSTAFMLLDDVAVARACQQPGVGAILVAGVASATTLAAHGTACGLLRE